MSEGDWCDPPPSNQGKWQRFTAELQERPGEWRCVCENRLERIGADTLRRLGCKVTERSVTTNEGRFYSVWAKWPE